MVNILPNRNLTYKNLVKGVLVLENLIIQNDGINNLIRYADIYNSEEMIGNFNNNLLFKNCEFKLPVVFDGTQFKGNVEIIDCIFQEPVTLNSPFNYLLIENGSFNNFAVFSSEVEAIVKFKSVKFNKSFNFFTKSVIDKKIEFTNCHFADIANFRNLNFGADTLFHNINLTNASFLFSNIDHVRFSDCRFDFEMLIDEKNLKDKKEEYPVYSEKDLLSFTECLKLILIIQKILRLLVIFTKKDLSLTDKHKI